MHKSLLGNSLKLFHFKGVAMDYYSPTQFGVTLERHKINKLMLPADI